MDLKPAIILGCHKIGLGIIRALGQKGVPLVGVSYSKMDMGTASKFLAAHHSCPHPDNNPEGFLDALVELGHKWNGAVLIPSDDATLVAVSRQKELLNRLFRVATNDWTVVEKCVVKKHTYSLAEQIGVPCPKTIVPTSLEDAKAFVGEIGFPCILKPTVGHSFFEKYRQKMLFVRSIENLEFFFAQLVDKGVELMLQEYISGDEACGANYNSLFVNGHARIEVTAQKVRLSPTRIGFPRVVVSRWIPELSDPATRFIKALGYDGFSCMEFKKDARDGIYKLMEINARLNLSTPLSVEAGVNFPYLLYKYTLCGEPPPVINTFKENIYWIDPGKDISESIRSYHEERFTLGEYLKPYLRPHVFSILSLSDIGPFFKRCRDMIREGLRHTFHN